MTATAVNSNRVNLTWTDNSGNETGFTIERALVTGGVPGPFTAIDGVGTNITTYSDPTVAPSTTYAYRVFAFNGAGNSQPSNVATVTTPAAPPAAPGNLTASVLSNPTRVQLSWTDNSNNENLFQVWRSTNGGAFTRSVRSTAPILSARRPVVRSTSPTTCPEAAAGNTYAYYVIAVNTVPNPDQASLPSNTVAVTISAPSSTGGSDKSRRLCSKNSWQ